MTKTQVTQLKTRKPEWLKATRELFNQVVEFYVLIYHTHPELADVSSSNIYKAVEPLTIVKVSRKSIKD